MSEAYSGFVQIAETKQVYEAELIRMRLVAEGIEAQLLDQTFAQEPMPDVRSFSLVRVLVPAESVEAARRVLAEPVDLPENGEGVEEGE